MHRLLIVDDEYIVVEGIKAIVERGNLGVEVMGCAYDGLDGKKMIEDEKPDIVITDIRMPGMTGLEMIDSLQVDSDIEFIIISGYQEFEYARKALQLGVNAYIDKPITVAGVKEALNQAMDTLIQKKNQKRRHKEEQIKQEYRKQRERLITMVSNNQHKGGNSQVTITLSCLKKCNYDLEEYKKETYSLVCLAIGVFYESEHGNRKDHRMPLYENIKEVKEYKIVDMFVMEMFRSIFEKIMVIEIGGIHKTIEKVLIYLDKHYQEDIGLSDIAQITNMHYTYLSILFKQEVGMSFIKYLTKIRMDHAKTFLEDGYKVHEVAKMTGYSNSRYFSDVFKQNEGMTPNEYKGNVRKKT